MQPAEATYDGIALGEHARSGEASIRISDAEIASVHESAEACLGDTSAADAAYSTSQAYADRIANKTVHNGSIHGFNAHELEGEGEGRGANQAPQRGNRKRAHRGYRGPCRFPFYKTLL